MNIKKLKGINNNKWFWPLVIMASMVICGLIAGEPKRFVLAALVMGVYFLCDIKRDHKIEKIISEKELEYRVYIVEDENLICNDKIKITYRNKDDSNDVFASTYSLEDFNRYKESGMLKSGIGSLQGMCISKKDDTVFDLDYSPYEAAVRKVGVAAHYLLAMTACFIACSIVYLPMGL